MTAEQIEKFFSSNVKSNSLIRISFKTCNAVVDIFVQTPDFDKLKSKNFWRIVPNLRSEEWKKTKDMELARVFNGASFTRLSEHDES